MNKRVLITVQNGVASAYADSGVDVVIVGLNATTDDDVMAIGADPKIDSRFVPLLRMTSLSSFEDWFCAHSHNEDENETETVNVGRLNDAVILPVKFDSNLIL